MVHSGVKTIISILANSPASFWKRLDWQLNGYWVRILISIDSWMDIKLICATWSLFSEAAGSQETCARSYKLLGHHKAGHLICPILSLIIESPLYLFRKEKETNKQTKSSVFPKLNVEFHVTVVKPDCWKSPPQTSRKY